MVFVVSDMSFRDAEPDLPGQIARCALPNGPRQEASGPELAHGVSPRKFSLAPTFFKGMVRYSMVSHSALYFNVLWYGVVE